VAGLSCHFKPLRFSPDELCRRITKIRHDFYKNGSAVRRLPVPYRQSPLRGVEPALPTAEGVHNIGSMRDFTEFSAYN